MKLMELREILAETNSACYIVQRELKLPFEVDSFERSDVAEIVISFNDGPKEFKFILKIEKDEHHYARLLTLFFIPYRSTGHHKIGNLILSAGLRQEISDKMRPYLLEAVASWRV